MHWDIFGLPTETTLQQQIARNDAPTGGMTVNPHGRDDRFTASTAGMIIASLLLVGQPAPKHTNPP
jgi:hypothetical protein